MADRSQIGVDTSAGRLLVAHPKLSNGFFSRSVVLITESSPAGHRGLVINKTIPEMTLRDIADQHGMHLATDRTLYAGGPLHKHALVIVHTNEWYSSNTMQVGAHLAVSSDHLMMEKIGMGNTPEALRCIAGWSQWSQGQLEQEIAQDNWMTIPGDPHIVFGTNGEKQWELAVAVCSQITIDSYF